MSFPQLLSGNPEINKIAGCPIEDFGHDRFPKDSKQYAKIYVAIYKKYFHNFVPTIRDDF